MSGGVVANPNTNQHAHPYPTNESVLTNLIKFSDNTK